MKNAEYIVLIIIFNSLSVLVQVTQEASLPESLVQAMYGLNLGIRIVRVNYLTSEE